MFTEQELREKGAKKATLDYIVEQDKSIPVPTEVPESEIGPGTILRSDHWREFDDFYGIFESVVIGDQHIAHLYKSLSCFQDKSLAIDFMNLKATGNSDADEYLNIRKKGFTEYCKAKGLDPDQVLSELRFFPQKLIESRVNGTIFSHPNVPGRHLMFLQSIDKNLSFDGLVFDFDGGKISNLRNYTDEWFYQLFDVTEDRLLAKPSEIEEIAKLYTKVVSLPKFQDGYSYMMEFSIEPNFVLQMRRFRELVDGSDVECDWKDEKNVIKTDLSFGVTPKEGILVPRAPNGLRFGYQYYDEEWNGEIYKFNNEHPEGFAYTPMDCSWHDKTFLKNITVAFGGDFGHYTHHGSQANFSQTPFYLFSIHNKMRSKESEEPQKDSKGLLFTSAGDMLRVFSNGREGYVKLEEKNYCSS